ncbi:hypothetical protein Fcan01_05350 [Folsomia candida]|uniref:Uncharacterized protein n=1 Tax=Folsomia candida TaxID=158441 RepID=A0A226ETW9_FOLCA|nr:hypothetical protein Fcan01_05350 [Folsomia candida]
MQDKQKGELMTVAKLHPSSSLHGQFHSSIEENDAFNANIPKRIKRPPAPSLDPRILVPKRLALLPIKPPVDEKSCVDAPTTATTNSSIRIPLGIVDLTKPIAYNIETHLRNSPLERRVTTLQIKKPSKSANQSSPTAVNDTPIMFRVVTKTHQAVETDPEVDVNDSDVFYPNSQSHDDSSKGPNRFTLVSKSISSRGGRKHGVKNYATQSDIEDDEIEDKGSSSKTRRGRVKKRLSRRERAKRQQEYCSFLSQPKNTLAVSQPNQTCDTSPSLFCYQPTNFPSKNLKTTIKSSSRIKRGTSRIKKCSLVKPEITTNDNNNLDLQQQRTSLKSILHLPTNHYSNDAVTTTQRKSFTDAPPRTVDDEHGSEEPKTFRNKLVQFGGNGRKSSKMRSKTNQIGEVQK